MPNNSRIRGRKALNKNLAITFNGHLIKHGSSLQINKIRPVLQMDRV